MDANALKVLQELQPGSDAQFFSDAMAMQIGKSGLTIATVLCVTAAIYYALCSLGILGSAKRSVFAIAAVFIAGIGAYFLNEKANSMRAIDDSKPILAITSAKLDYDVRRDGWSIPWASIREIELVTDTTRKKQSTDQTTYEIRVHTKPTAVVTWKYEPSIDNDIVVSKKLQEMSAYLVINPEPMGISADELQKALEKYRAGL